MGRKQSAFSQWLNGTMALSEEAASQFAKLLGCSVFDFSPTLGANIASKSSSISNELTPVSSRVEMKPSVTKLALVDRKARNNGGTGGDDAEAAGNADPGPDLAPIRMVPIVSMVQAGSDGYFAVVGVIEGEFVPFYTRSVNAYALRVRGDSMRPRIRNGEIIVADPDKVYGPEDDVVVKLVSGEYMVKELLIERADEIVVTSVNNGERRTIAKANIEYIHRVVDIMGRGI